MKLSITGIGHFSVILLLTVDVSAQVFQPVFIAPDYYWVKQGEYVCDSGVHGEYYDSHTRQEEGMFPRATQQWYRAESALHDSWLGGDIEKCQLRFRKCLDQEGRWGHNLNHQHCTYQTGSNYSHQRFSQSIAAGTFRNSNFEGTDASATNLIESNLFGSNLTSANFTDANLTYSHLSSVEGQNASFYRANLDMVRMGSNLCFTGHSRNEWDFADCYQENGANFEGANFNESKLRLFATGSTFRLAAMNGIVPFFDRHLQGFINPRLRVSFSDFSGASMEGSHFPFSEILMTTMEGLRAPRVKFSFSTIRGVDFSYADLREARFNNARIYGALGDRIRYPERSVLIKGREISLGYTRFYQADLRGADLRRAKIRSDRQTITYWDGDRHRWRWHEMWGSPIDFRGANLSGAQMNLTAIFRADMRGANLSGVNLEYGALCGSDLTGADLTGANLNNVIYDRPTRLPFDDAEAARRGMILLAAGDGGNWWDCSSNWRFAGSR